VQIPLQPLIAKTVSTSAKLPNTISPPLHWRRKTLLFLPGIGPLSLHYPTYGPFSVPKMLSQFLTSILDVVH